MRRSNPTKAILAALAACLTLVAARPALAQDWRGVGRIHGTVVDETGKPVEGASLKAHCAERGGGTTIKTNKKGEWVLGGVVGCNWAFDVSAEGYETLRRLSAENGDSAEIQYWLFENMLVWQDKSHALQVAMRLIERHVGGGDCYPALELLRRCRRLDPKFTVATATAGALAEFARSIGQHGLADELVAARD